MRELDVVLFGATGFTGRLAAIELARRGAKLRWGLAGRDAGKLAELRDELVAGHGAPAELPLLTARSDDADSLRELTTRTRVVATTVGPYDRHGDGLVAACVEHGCDYVDITGEPAFWQRNIARHHERAVAAGVLVVSCCGFDSIPHDLGAWVTARALADERSAEIDGYVRITGAPSGGTWASLIHALSQLRHAKPAAPKGERTGAGPRKPMRPHFEPAVQQWVVPFPSVDPLVVKRSLRFCADVGPDVQYRHWLQTKTLARTASLLGGVAGIALLAQLGPTRRWLLSKIPSGDGPSEPERAKSKFTATFVGRGASGRTVRTTVSGRDPGYGLTAVMLVESARVLVEDRDRLPHRGGVLTPASALHEPLLARLRGAGLEIDVA